MGRRRFLLVICVATLSGCERTPLSAPPPEPPVVSVATPVAREYQPFADFTGRTAAIEEVEVRPRVGGFLERVLFEDGADVEAGEVLIEIDARPFQAEVDRYTAEVAEAESAFKQSDVEYRRMEDLYQKESATQIEFERQTAAREMARAKMEAAKAALERARLDLDWTKVTAPISGRTSRSFVDAGNLVQGGFGAGTVLTRIVTKDPIHVYLDVDERTVLTCQQKIREGKMQKYRDTLIPLRLGLANEEGFPHEGGVDFVDNRVDASTGTLRVRGKFDNPQSILVPGLFARVRLMMGEAGQAIFVSERALGFDQGQRYVLVVSAKNEVEYRRVTVGALDGQLRVIEEGVGPEDRVIVTGLQRVRPGVTVKPKLVDMTTLKIVLPPSQHSSSGVHTASSRPATSTGE